MADDRRRGHNTIIPSTLTEIALLLLFGFMLVAEHFAREAAGLRERLNEANTALRSRVLPSCYFIDGNPSRIGYFLIVESKGPDRFKVRINSSYMENENNTSHVKAKYKIDNAIKEKYRPGATVDSSTLKTDFPQSFTDPLPPEDMNACKFHAGIDDIANPPRTDSRFVWSKYKP